MKKFFQWLLPAAWFTIHVTEEKVTTFINYDELPQPKHEFELLIIDNESDLTHIELGITTERGQKLQSMTTDAVRSSPTITGAMNKIAPNIKHMNEYFMCVLIMEKYLNHKRNPMAGLIADLLKDSFGQSDED